MAIRKNISKNSLCSLLFWTVCLLALTDLSNGKLRKRRQGSPIFTVISNSSFECNSTTKSTTAAPAMMSSMHVPPEHAPLPAKPVRLTPEELTLLMQDKKVTSDGTFTATTVEQTSYFPNLLALPEQYKVKVKEELNIERDNVLLKSEIVEFLRQISQRAPAVRRPTDTMSSRIKRQTSLDDTLVLHDGTEMVRDGSTTQYCYERGTPTKDANYLYMCTTCAYTTDLGEDYWPRYVNEAGCDSTDNNCIIFDHVSAQHLPRQQVMKVHGKCQSIELPLNVLHRQEGQCVLALKDGQTIVVESWQPTIKVIQVGCECTVDARSFFANFL